MRKLLKILVKSRLRDKKELVISLLSIVLASVLMFTVALVFSAVHHCLIKTVNKGYTVIIEGKLKGYDNYLKNGDYYFNFRPKDVYEKVESICEKGVCNKIIYNNKLLSLYGIGDDNYLKTIKNILVFILGIIAVSVFLIIYNSFKVSFSKRKSEIIIMKAIGLESGKIIAMCLFEQIIISLLGILFGFVLALFLTDGLILILNELLKEIIKEDIKIYFNFSFILISLLFIIGVSFISCFLAVLKIRKYQIMDIFREKASNNITISYNIKQNIPYYFAKANYVRDKKKFKPLIISIFLFTFLAGVFSCFLGYVNKGVTEYVISPDYDVSISSLDNINYMRNDIKARKSVGFKSCEDVIKIQEVNYKTLITNLGGDEVINRVYDVREISGKFQKVNEKLFNKNISLSLNGKNYDLVLNDNIPFGFKDKLKEGNLVINLDEKNFNEVCDRYNYNLILNIDENIDEYLSRKNVSYFNAKKARRITNNLILGINLMLYGMVFLIWLVILSSTISILSLSMDFRRKYFAVLKSLGFTEAFKVLVYESLNITLRGFIYSVPFIFLADRFLYECASLVFSDVSLILNLPFLFISVIFNFFMILLIFSFMHKSFFKKSLASNLR